MWNIVKYVLVYKTFSWNILSIIKIIQIAKFGKKYNHTDAKPSYFYPAGFLEKSNLIVLLYSCTAESSHAYEIISLNLCCKL